MEEENTAPITEITAVMLRTYNNLEDILPENGTRIEVLCFRFPRVPYPIHNFSIYKGTVLNSTRDTITLVPGATEVTRDDGIEIRNGPALPQNDEVRLPPYIYNRVYWKPLPALPAMLTPKRKAPLELAAESPLRTKTETVLFTPQSVADVGGKKK